MRIDTPHEVRTTRDFDRKFTEQDAHEIREALLPLGWDVVFEVRLTCAALVMDLSISAMPIKPDDEGILR